MLKQRKLSVVCDYLREFELGKLRFGVSRCYWVLCGGDWLHSIYFRCGRVPKSLAEGCVEVKKYHLGLMMM